jgi:Mechanosensitive ion channel
MQYRACALVAFCLATIALGEAGQARATTQTPPDRAAAPEQSVLPPLQRTIAWYQEARIVMQSIRGVLDTDFDRGEEQTAQRAVQRAFEIARARAAVVGEDAGSATSDGQVTESRARKRAQLRAAVEAGEREVARLEARVRAATTATRPALERELAAATNRRDLGRAQLDFLAKLVQIDAPGEEADLPSQVQALQDAIPELGSASSAPTVVTTPTPAVVAPSGAWALVYRLLALQRNRSALKTLTRSTAELVKQTDSGLQDTRQSVRPVVARLRELAENPTAGGAELTAGQQEFRTLLGRAKLQANVVLLQREESALLHRYAGDIQAWSQAIDREITHVFRGLAMELVGVVIALAAIVVGSVIWRVAVVRYVANAYHRRLLLTVRHVVVVTAIALVLVFHFTSELTALVAALGFAAAGIAFALQNVILAVAGYFSMVAPNGIRVGDRVSLQGPFGYVHGEVIEIGVVRTRLRELAGDPLRPTGRIMVVPNTVAFTGSFLKHPPSEGQTRGSPGLAPDDSASSARHRVA